MQKNHYFVLKKFKNTESAQLCRESFLCQLAIVDSRWHTCIFKKLKMCQWNEVMLSDALCCYMTIFWDTQAFFWLVSENQSWRIFSFSLNWSSLRAEASWLSKAARESERERERERREREEKEWKREPKEKSGERKREKKVSNGMFEALTVLLLEHNNTQLYCMELFLSLLVRN